MNSVRVRSVSKAFCCSFDHLVVTGAMMMVAQTEEGSAFVDLDVIGSTFEDNSATMKNSSAIGDGARNQNGGAAVCDLLPLFFSFSCFSLRDLLVSSTFFPLFSCMCSCFRMLSPLSCRHLM